MICLTGLAPWEFEFPFPGSLTSTFLVNPEPSLAGGSLRPHGLRSALGEKVVHVSAAGAFRKRSYFTEMCSGSEAGSYLRPIEFLYAPTLGVINSRRESNKEEEEACKKRSIPTILVRIATIPAKTG